MPSSDEAALGVGMRTPKAVVARASCDHNIMTVKVVSDRQSGSYWKSGIDSAIEFSPRTMLTQCFLGDTVESTLYVNGKSNNLAVFDGKRRAGRARGKVHTHHRVGRIP